MLAAIGTASEAEVGAKSASIPPRPGASSITVSYSSCKIGYITTCLGAKPCLKKLGEIKKFGINSLNIHQVDFKKVYIEFIITSGSPTLVHK